MDTLLTVCGITAMYALNVLIMYVLAWFVTEVVHLPWKVKPFTCRGCMAFWLTLAGGLVLAFVIRDDAYGRYALAGYAVLTAFLNFLYIKSKYQINE